MLEASGPLSNATTLLRTIQQNAIIRDMRTIVLELPAMKDLDALPVEAREQVSEALAAYSVHGLGDIKRLSGRQGFRLRVGRYRVIFNEDRSSVVAIYIGKRETTTYSRH